MGKNTNMVNIDGGKLSELIDKTGLTAKVISLSMGYDQSYISKAIFRNRIGKPGTIGLEREFGISLTDYIKSEGMPKKVEDVPENADKKLAVDYEKLLMGIETAIKSQTEVLRGLKEAIDQQNVIILEKW